MFSSRRRSRTARALGLSDDELLRAAGRIAGYVAKHGADAPVIADALRFLVDTIDAARAAREDGGWRYHFRSPSHRKWEMEVVRLYHQGWGAKRISDAIAQKKGPRIGKTTIERFLAKNGITRG